MYAKRLLRLVVGAVAGLACVLGVGKLTLVSAVKDVDRALFDAIVPVLQAIPGAISLSDRVTDIGAVAVNYGMAIALGAFVLSNRRDPLRGLLIPAVLMVSHLVQRLTIRVVDGFEPTEYVIGDGGPYFSGGVQRVVLLTGVMLLIARPEKPFSWIVRWAVLVGAVEAFTRLVLGRHWPTDLVASFPIGLVELAGFRILWEVLPTPAGRTAEG